jgi:hypothetical protein
MQNLGLTPEMLDFFAGTAPKQTPAAQLATPPPSAPLAPASEAIDPVSASEPFQGLFDDDAFEADWGAAEALDAPLLSAGPSALDKAKKKGGDALAAGKKVARVAKKVNDMSALSAGSTKAGKALNIAGKVAGVADKAAYAFPPAKIVTEPVSKAVGLAKKAHQATHAYKMVKSGEAQPLIGLGEDEDSFDRAEAYDDLVAGGGRSDD